MYIIILLYTDAFVNLDTINLYNIISLLQNYAKSYKIGKDIPNFIKN